jgi:hypothetical protein
MNLLPKEEEILTADNEIMTLTTYRIRKTNKDWGLFYSIEFFLEDISSVELRAQSIPLLVVLAGLCILLGLFILMNAGMSGSGGAAALMFVVGLVLILPWAASKQRIIKITSNSGLSMGFDVKKLGPGKTQELLDKVQEAKSVRMDYLRRS